MSAPKVCLGCFQEWEEENSICPYCGWEPGKVYDDILGWTPGNIFEKRYLLGLPYCMVTDAVVWRVFDNLLRISCFVLRMMPETTEELYLAAERIKKIEDLTGKPVKLLTIRKMNQKNVLLFSMKDADRKKDVLEAVLRGKNRKSEEEASVRESSETDRKKEQALPPGTLLDNRYQILESIGIGGFGIVYLCEELALKRLVAVKEYFPAEWAERDESYVAVKKSQMVEPYRFGMQSFYREAQMMAKFLHTAHVVTIYDVMEENDTVYLVMEYIPGISIGREMRARDYRPYELGEAAEILFPVMEALEELHEEKIIHSDISPGNIMRSGEGEIVLIDMGAAKYALDSQPTLSAAFLKPDYAAPEQYRTAKEGIPKDEGSWTDVYALGATLYYLLTGQKPVDVMQRLSGKKTDVVLPKKCRLKHARQWTKLLNRAMALDIRERFHSVEDFKKEWENLLE